jgi:hypothetical protein
MRAVAAEFRDVNLNRLKINPPPGYVSETSRTTKERGSECRHRRDYREMS